MTAVHLQKMHGGLYFAHIRYEMNSLKRQCATCGHGSIPSSTI